MKYKDYSKSDLLNELHKVVKKGKREGSITDKKIKETVNDNTLILIFCRSFPDDSYRQFIEQVKRYEYDGERERISCRSDCSRKYEHDCNSMPSVLLQKFLIYETKAGENPRKKRYLEDKPHDEYHHEEGSHI